MFTHEGNLAGPMLYNVERSDFQTEYFRFHVVGYLLMPG